MCTTAAKILDKRWFLIKTRDPVEWMRWDDEIRLFADPQDRFRKLIIGNPDARQDGFYGGMNEAGVAFTSTYVHTHPDQVSYIRKPYVRLILNAATAKEAVDIILSFNPKIGGNMFIADVHECYGIESTPDEYFVERITDPSVKTNHYLHLPARNLGFDRIPGFESWSHTHQARAEELIANAVSVDDLKDILRDRKNADRKEAICTTADEAECCTYSAFIFDTEEKAAYYCQGNPLQNEFKRYAIV